MANSVGPRARPCFPPRLIGNVALCVVMDRCYYVEEVGFGVFTFCSRLHPSLINSGECLANNTKKRDIPRQYRQLWQSPAISFVLLEFDNVCLWGHWQKLKSGVNVKVVGCCVVLGQWPPDSHRNDREKLCSGSSAPLHWTCCKAL